MASNNPFEIVQPRNQEEGQETTAPDPFAIAQPRMQEQVAANPFQIVESVQDDLDSVEPQPSFLDRLINVHSVATAGVGPTASDTAKRLGEGLGAVKEGIINTGQLGKAFFSATAPTEISGKLTEQAIEETGRMTSSQLELVGKVFSDLTGTDEGRNLLFQTGRTIREASRTPDEQLADEKLWEKFSRGLIQTGSFALGGKVISETLKKGPKAAGAIAAWLGAGVGGQAGREDAIRHGAEPWQVDTAFYLNSIFGTSEGLPVGAALGRIDDLAGGAISRKFRGKAGEMTLGAIRAAIDEGMQEAFQTLGENWTAADLAAYDPERSITENIGEAAGIGGGTGALLGLVGTALGIRNRTEAQRKIKEQVLDPLGANSLDEIAGPLVRLDDEYLNTLNRMQQNKEVIEERAGENTDLETAFLTHVQSVRKFYAGKGEGGFIFPSIGTSSNLLGTRDEQALGMSAYTTNLLATTPTNKEIEGDKTVFERINETPVVAALTKGLDFLDTQIEGAESSLKSLQADKKASKEDISRIENRLKVLKKLRPEQVKVARELKNLFADLRGLYKDQGNARFILTDNISGGSPAGSYHHIYLNAGAKDGTPIRVDVIELNLDEYMEAFQNLEHAKINKAEKVRIARLESILANRKNELLSTALHEFGHGYAFQSFHETARRIEQGTATEEEIKIFSALRNDYMEHVISVLSSSYAQGIERVMSLPRAMRQIEARTMGLGSQSIADFVASRPDPASSNKTGWREEFSQPYIERENSDRLDYLLSMSEFFAEHFAATALNERNLLRADSQKFFKEGLKDIRKGLAKAKGRFAQDAPALTAYFRNHGLRRKLLQAGENLQKNVETNPLLALAQDGLLNETISGRGLGEDLDRFNKFMDIGFNILQIAEQNPHIAGLQSYVQNLRLWKNDVNNNLAVAEDRLNQWKALGSKENEQLARLLLDETIGRKPDGGWLSEPRRFTPEEVAEYGLSEEALAIREAVKEDFNNSLSQMEEVLIAAKRRIYATDPVEQQREVMKVQKEFRDMRSRPYFPLMRFGQYIFQVRANGEQTIEGRNYKDGDIVEFQSFDTKKERDKAVAQIRKEYVPNRVNISSSAMVIPNFSLQGMPLTLIEHLESKLSSTSLDEKVQEAIRQVKNDVLPFKSFRKQFQRRKRVEGYSLDAQRAYANYMTSFANHIARVNFDSKFKEDFENVENSIKVINRKDAGDSTKRAQILNHMNAHLQYVMNPVNEFVGIRSAAFFWYLGFNVKSAFVNLTQIPLVTYPYLAARYGDGRAVAQLTRAYNTAIRLLTKPDSADSGIQQMVEQGLNESWLDESLATELALAASEKNLDKSLPRKWRQKAMLKISQWGSLPFHVAEKLNRHVTAIAAYRLAISEKKGHEGAVEEARRAVEKTQFEYARWARPKFMRGPVGGTIFVFQSYLQNALYFALGGDPGAFRMILMLFLVAGLQGIPFGENIMDLYDAAMTALKKRTGQKDPNTQIRVELRQLMKDMEMDPDLILHGMSSSTFGFANIGEFMGWPIPDLDLSGSLSMGRIIPGTELLQPGQADSFDQLLARGTERTGGAAVAAGVGIGKALMDNHPDQWKRWEKAMPSFMRQISKSARYSVRGGEKTRAGAPIGDEFDLQDTRDHAEVIAQALGFTPRDVSRGWEGFIAKQQSVIFYETWKTSLLRQWNYSKYNGLEEAVKEANQEIREYNKVVPFAEMKVGPATRRQSYLSYVSGQKHEQAEIEQRKAFRRLSDSVEAVFAEGDN